MANGMGGLEWDALPLFVELEEVDDVELLVHRLLVMKLHQPPEGTR